MPATAEAPLRGFVSSDFDGPDVPPDNAPLDPNAAPAVEPKASEEPAPVETAPPETPATDAPPETSDGDEATSLTEAMDRQAAATKTAETDRLAAEAAAKAPAADPEKPKVDPKPEDTRDADLKTEFQHVQPKTRKIITEFQSKAKAARDERDAAAAKVAELEKRITEAEAKAKAVPVPAVPKETDEELKTLRERVRELDITKDPEIESRFDRKIAGNNTNIVNVLKAQGFGTTMVDGKAVENPKAVTDLIQSGLTLKTLQPYIAKLEEAGLVDEADSIREGIRENNRIARDKQEEITKWKGNYDQRVQQREAQTKQQQEQRSESFRQQTQAVLKADLDALAKDFPYINPPAAPLPNDPPALAKAKQAALEEYNAAREKIQAAVKEFDTSAVAPEKLADVVGKLNASAIQGVLLKTQVIPRMLRESAASAARIKQLESELSAIRGAGKLSRAQGATPSTDNPSNGKPAPASLDEALGQFGGQHN